MGAGAGYFNPMAGFNTKPPSDPKAWRDHFGALAEMEDEEERRYLADVVASRATMVSWGKKRLEDDLRAQNAQLRGTDSVTYPIRTLVEEAKARLDAAVERLRGL